MNRFAGQRALVTGASSGIGKAIALALAAESAEVHGVSRVVPEIPGLCMHKADLNLEADIRRLAEEVGGPLHLLVHSAGHYAVGTTAETSHQVLDELYRVNTRAPYLLTQLLLPKLLESKGQVVVLNSSVSQVPGRAGLGGYAMSKYALRALTDALRGEVNAGGVRVLSIYPGRTASRMQQQVHQIEGKPYRPELLLQPEDIAQSVLQTLLLPRTAELTDLQIRPMQKT